jgi:hypothetical protein
VAFLLFGLPLIVRPGPQFVGEGFDGEIFVWGFGWLPHAISHAENPFVTRAIWIPDGVNLTWTTTSPGLAALAWPLTALVGPIGSYNAVAALLPAAAAWTGYLLCRYITRAFWPSVVGGFLFGFSSYVVAQVRGGHAHMSSVFLLPLAALVILRFLDQKVSGRRLAVELGVLLALEVLFSTEVTFTLTLAILAGVALGFAFVPARRPRLRALIPHLLAAYVVAGVLTAPFLYFAVTDFHSALNTSDIPGDDLLNFVVPTRATLAFGHWASNLSSRFPGSTPEKGAYLGLPTLLVIVLFARERWRTPSGRFLLSALAVALLAALGAKLSVAGREVVALPWDLVRTLPLFDNVITGRLAVYVTLLAALVVALWTAARRSGPLYWALPLLAMIALVPNPRAAGFTTTYEMPVFFTDSAYHGCLRPNENILLIPQPTQTLWQAADGFRFNLAGGYVGPGAIPESYTHPESYYAIVQGMHIGLRNLGLLRSFVRAKHVTSIVIKRGDGKFYRRALSTLAPRQRVGGVVIYHLTGPTPTCIPSSR